MRIDIAQRSAPALGLTTAHSKIIIGFNTACLTLATIAVLLRVYARRLKRSAFVAEDYLVFVALLGLYGQSILTYCVVIFGAAGHPQKDVSPKNVEASLQILAGQGVCYGVAMTLSKWSICLLYKRIFVVRSFRIATYIVMSIIFAWGVLAFTVTWAWCVPIAYGWDITIPGGHCANRDAGYLAVGIIDAITDLFILILPLPMIWKLQIPRARQISLAVIFSIAVLSMIVSAMRAYYTSIISFDDFTDSRSLLDVFSAIEPATSIIVASSLVLGPVLKKWSHRLPGYGSSKSNNSGGGGGGLPNKSNGSSGMHTFKRIKNNDSSSIPGGTSDSVFQGMEQEQDIELGGSTVMVPTTTASATTSSRGSPWPGNVGRGRYDSKNEEYSSHNVADERFAVVDDEDDDTRRLAVKEGKDILVRRDFEVATH